MQVRDYSSSIASVYASIGKRVKGELKSVLKNEEIG